MRYFIKYVCKDSDGKIIERIEDRENLFDSKYAAKKEKKARVEIFNIGCTKGIWSARIYKIS